LAESETSSEKQKTTGRVRLWQKEASIVAQEGATGAPE
jgi:hypothetical protein